ncbi:hypothetical protein WJX84_003595 [Apatococcus fuscideae]|uniref:Uncharacterized protein n=2 Tax=Apatococcus fuscideae TaxID=2026836 RepID=A0AAW1SQT8_9CHLO
MDRVSNGTMVQIILPAGAEASDLKIPQAAAAGLADLCFQRDRAEQCDIACTIQEGRPFVCQLQQIVCSPGPRQYQVSVKGLMPFLREADIDASDVLTLTATASCDILEAADWMPDIKGPGRLVSLCVDEAGEQTSGYASDTFLTGMAKIFLDLQVRAGDEIAIYRPSNIQLDLLMGRSFGAAGSWACSLQGTIGVSGQPSFQKSWPSAASSLPHAASNSGPLPAPSRAPHGSLRAGPPSSASLRPQELGKAHANWSDPGQAPALLLSAAPDQNAPHPAGFHMPLCQTAAGRQAKQRAQRISDVPAQDESGSGVWSDPAALDAGQMLRHRDKRGSRLLQNAALGLTRPGEEGPRQAPAEPLDSALALPSLGGNAGPWAPGPRLTNELEAEQAFGKMLKACSDTFATYMDYLRQRQG